MNSESEKPGFVYSFESIPKKIKNILIDILDDEPEITVEELLDTKWKFYHRASKILIFNSDDQLILGDRSDVKTGNWQYMEHSNLLLMSFEHEDKINHLIYSIVALSENILVLSPHQSDKQDAEVHFEIYYKSKRKPKVKEIEEDLIRSIRQGQENLLDTTIVVVILAILILCYFLFVY